MFLKPIYCSWETGKRRPGPRRKVEKEEVERRNRKAGALRDTRFQGVL
jgi:hypothetical protein